MSRSEEALAEEFERLRPLLFSIAYRMLGSVSEAEDVVQDSFLRFHGALTDGVEIGSAKSYLSAVTTRLAIDRLRSARVRRERYVGPWLPEPLVTDRMPDVAEHAETADTLLLAFLVLLERLSPVERAVFLLHDVFGYEFTEIAGIVEKSEDNCRQLAVRARRHMEDEKPRFEASRGQRQELAERFLAACLEGDTQGLIDLLAADVVMVGDGGGKAPAVRGPVAGAERVARFLVGLSAQGIRMGLTAQPAEVNGQPGALFFDPEGGLVSVLALDVADGLVQGLRSIVNPDKLRHLGPVGDLQRTLRG